MEFRNKNGCARHLVTLPILTAACTISVLADEYNFEEIEIRVTTGSKMPRVASEVSSEVKETTSWSFSQQGIHQPTDYLATQTRLFSNHANSDNIAEISLVGAFHANSSGLGPEATLVLVNSNRRVLSAATTSDGAQAVNLAELPPAIVYDRVEFQPSGASSVYGSDAVAGVINYITHDNFQGWKLTGDFAATRDGQNDKTFNAMVGQRYGNAHVLTAFSYLERSPLSAADVSKEYELRNAGSIFGQPATYLIDGVPVPDPACEEVAQSNPETTSFTGSPGFCNFDFGDFFGIINQETVSNFYSEVKLDLSGGGSLNFEASYVQHDTTATTSPTQPLLVPSVIIPVDNPGNFAGDPMLMFGRVNGSGSGATEISVTSDTYHLLSGLTLPLSEKWELNGTLSYGRNDYGYSDPSDIAVDRFLAAINGEGGPNGDLYYNPLYGANNDPAVLDDIRGVYAYDAESSLAVADVYLTGSLAELPAGDLKMVVGAQYQYNKLEYWYNDDANNDNLFFFIGNADFETDKQIAALFTELIAPISKTATLEAGLRYEDQDGFQSTDPKIGVAWHLTDDFTVTANYSTSFRAPSPFQDGGQITTPSRVFDTVVGDQVTVSQRTVSDPEDPLTAEESTNYNVGVKYQSPIWTASLNYYRYDYSDIITAENASAVVAVDPFGAQVVRDPTTNALLAVTTFFRNAGGIETDGLDGSLTYQATDKLAIKWDTTWVLSYDVDDPILGKVDGLGSLNATNFADPMQEIHSNVGVFWEGENHAANLIARYIDDYRDDDNDGAIIDRFVTLDAQWRYDIPSLFGFNDAFTVIVGAKNLTDESAPDVANRNGFDPRTAPGYGRQVYGSFEVQL